MVEDGSRQLKLALNVMMLIVLLIIFIHLGKLANNVYGVFAIVKEIPVFFDLWDVRVAMIVTSVFYFLFYREKPFEKLALRAIFIEHIFIVFTVIFAIYLDDIFLKDQAKLFANLIFLFTIPLSFKNIRNLFPFLALSFQKDIGGKDKSDKDSFFPLDNTKDEGESTFSFKASAGKNKGFINIKNPFQGIAIIGGAGAGKTYTWINPILRLLPQMGFCGFIYDYKYPEQSTVLYRAWVKAKKAGKTDVNFFVINFTDLQKTNRFNPLSPEVIENRTFCQEYCEVLLKNLNPDWIRKPDFWYTESLSMTMASLWFLKRNAPYMCTLPHLTSLLLHKITDTVTLLANDEDCAELISSVIGSIERNAEGQVSGTESSYQNPFKKINTEEIFWVTTGNDFNLDINNPDDPKFLCIGNDELLRGALNPIISLVATVAIKHMNRDGKRKSIFAGDEIATQFITGLEMLPATARSRKLATMLGFQDYSLIEQNWGKEKARSLNANLGNQVIGMVTDVQTAEMISKYFGHDDFKKASYSYSDNESYTVSTQRQAVMEVKDIITQEKGHFVGKTTEGKLFSANIYAEDCPNKDIEIPNISSLLTDKAVINDIIRDNYNQVKEDIRGLLKRYEEKARNELIQLFREQDGEKINHYIKLKLLKLNSRSRLVIFKGYTFTFDEVGYEDSGS